MQLHAIFFFSEEENVESRKIIKNDLERFRDNEFMHEYIFPSTLTSYERMLVHEVCILL